VNESNSEYPARMICPFTFVPAIYPEAFAVQEAPLW
jgi:hypothetical protein